MADICNTDDIIDVRDVIARVEELREEREDLAEVVRDCEEAIESGDMHSVDIEDARRGLDGWNTDNGEELALLESLLEECKGNGGDEQWEGDWYPLLLIRDSHFQDYAQELADDIGAIDPKATWPCNCIDWEQAARELQMDYTGIEFDGVTYWTR